MKHQYQNGFSSKSGVRAFITKRGKGWFMSKPLRINGVRHTLVEKWLLLSPWEYPRLLSNVPGSDYASEVFSYQTLCMNHPADYSLDIDTDFRESLLI